MASVLFVHGTGVRRGSYLSTFAVITRAFERVGIPHRLAPCLWGDVLGAGPVLNSVPDVTLTRPDASVLTDEQDYALWDLLYRDPLFELRLLAHRPSTGPRPPADGDVTADLWARISRYRPSAEVLTPLREANLEVCWTPAWQRIVLDDDTARHAVTRASEVGEPAQAVARAVVAALLDMAFAEDLPQLSREVRDALADRLVDEWDARVAGVGAFLIRFAADTVASIATPVARWRRGSLSEAANPAAGDILRYQARGAPIRDHIRASIERLPGDVYLLAHSLGGIACVDLLAQERIGRVAGLITVGSQAPYLHEIGALVGLAAGARDLPAHFPRWLNLYDPYDFLSYVAEPVFRGSNVRDCCIRSGQPFPHSHSAYWTNGHTWNAIAEFLA